MSKATTTVEAFVATDLTVRNAGEHRVVDVSLPHTPSKRNDSGQWEDTGPTTWFTASFWDEHADEILNTIQKGTLVTVTGYPELETYLKNDGTPGGRINLKFPTLAVVVRKPKRGEAAPAQEPWAATPAADTWNTPAGYTDTQPF